MTGVLPNWQDVNSFNWEVEELCQEGQAVLTKMAELKNELTLSLNMQKQTISAQKHLMVASTAATLILPLWKLNSYQNI